MPLYDYCCNSCDSKFELLKRMSDRDEIENDICPECGVVGNISRQVSAPMIAYSVSVNGIGKPPEGFLEVLRKIHKNAPGSCLDKTSSFM